MTTLELERNPATTTRDAHSDDLAARRIDLAAAHRAAVYHDLHEGIANHFTASVPDAADQFLVTPYGLHWSEVKASDFLTVNVQGHIEQGAGIVEQSAFCIHAPIHQSDPLRHAVVLHTHMPYATALTRLADQRLKPIGQIEVILINHIAYDDNYDGLAYDVDEGHRLARILGSKSILFLANHGVVVTGKTVAQAYDKLYLLERAARLQVLAYSTGQPLKYLSEEQVKKVDHQFRETAKEGASWTRGKPSYALHFDALKRILDKENPGYQF